ncbi:MAG: metal ABC transporter ATP-binding protein [Rhodospirillaceae bacterium]
MADLISLHGVTLGYDRHPAVHHLTGGFACGSLTAVVGPNGAGKSTLLKGIMGMLRPFEGRVDLKGLRRAEIAYLPQQAEIDRSFPINVLDTVLLGHWRTTGAFRTVKAPLAAQARTALAAVGLVEFEHRPIGSLSVGQFQRVLFARMLVQDARLILLDEPFTAIDSRTTLDLLRLIEAWHGQGRTVIVVLHDFVQVRKHFPMSLLLAREPVAWGTTINVLTPENLAQAKAMSEAWDEHAGRCERGPTT